MMCTVISSSDVTLAGVMASKRRHNAAWQHLIVAFLLDGCEEGRKEGRKDGR
jgi:hypothetical protein